MKPLLFISLGILCFSGCKVASLLNTEISALQATDLSVLSTDSTREYANYSPSTNDHSAQPVSEQILSDKEVLDGDVIIPQKRNQEVTLSEGSEIYIYPTPADTTDEDIEYPIVHQDAKNALVLGLVSIWALPFGLFIGIAGIRMAKKALAEIRAEPEKYTGLQAAKVGYTLSIVGIVLGSAVTLAVIALIIAFFILVIGALVI